MTPNLPELTCNHPKVNQPRRLTLGFYHLFYTILNSKCGFASESRHDLENSTKLLPVIQEHPEL